MNLKRIENAIRQAKQKIVSKQLDKIGARPVFIQTGKRKGYFVIVETSDTAKLKRVEELKPVCEAHGIDLSLIMFTRSLELEGLE